MNEAWARRPIRADREGAITPDCPCRALPQAAPQAVRIVEERPESPSIYHLLPGRFDDRDAVAAALRSQGIETGVHYAHAVHQHPAWSEGTLVHGELPNAEAWAAQELSLPMHPDLRDDEIERVVEAVAGAVVA